MAKRMLNEGNSNRVEVKKEVFAKKQTYTPKTTRIVSLRNKTVNAKGSVTGATYVFKTAGSVVSVDERDAPEILARKAGRSCCGAGFTHYFMIQT